MGQSGQGERSAAWPGSPGRPRRPSAIALLAALLAHACLLASMLHPSRPDAARAQHLRGGRVDIGILSAAASGPASLHTLVTGVAVAAVSVPLRQAPALRLPDVAVPPGSAPEPSPGLTPAPLGIASPAPAAAVSAQLASQSLWQLRLARTQALRQAQAELSTELQRAGMPAGRCQQTGRDRLVCAPEAAGVPPMLLQRLLAQSQEARQLGLSEQPLRLQLGADQILTIRLLDD